MAKLYKLVLYAGFLALVPFSLKAATLSVTPASGSYEVGDQVTVRVLVSSAIPINAVSSVLSFPTAIFSVDSVSKAGSILNFWVTEPNFSQGAGTLSFEGVTLGGYPGGTGTVVSVKLRAIKAGTGAINFQSGQVLANDGEGTNVTDGMTGATFSVTPASAPPTPVVTAPAVEEAPQPEPSLKSPAISLTSKYGEQAIAGSSDYPKAQVLLTFVAESGVKIFITGTTDESGSFVLVVPQTLKRGRYKVSAVVIQADTSNSFSSNELEVPVGSLLADLGWGTIVAILLLVLALIYFIVRSFEHFREGKELEETVHKSFKLLREDVGDTRQTRKDLTEAEALISDRVKEIEKP